MPDFPYIQTNSILPDLPAPNEIHILVDRFRQNREAYTSGEYNETQLRREFLDAFFTALGWDVENKKGYAEAYKDVVHEDSIKIGTATKAPDYSFRIGGVRKFFVEAKKPSVDLKDDPAPSYQLRRYAWSAKLPLSILTDFEELAIYDCRIKPKPTDKPSVGRVLYFKYEEYADKWDEIAAIFSRDAVLKGSFDKYVESTKGKRGTAEVDDAFLTEIEGWRELLAKNIAANNPKLSVRDLNFAVQRTIDRIIFLRICEDRGIETYGTLLGLVNGTRIYKRLCEVFYRADEKFNSGLFHFQKEKDRSEPPDEFTPGIDIDDKVLKEIIKGLYYPDSSYEFSVLPADILGQVYEQFLGKIIRLTPSHQAKVEDKPEVKKAGGVYYTPTYIVEYIVKNTVGKLLEELTSKEKDKKILKSVAKLRILDPACGSGSFLIGAYQYLLDWHRDWYVNDGPEKWAIGKSPVLYQAQGGEWRLTAAERKRILLNNIYGVDIDPQAVEVTKLSLLLKVLEGENEQTISRQLKIFHERALPDLAKNIKCGNSLIGPDFYEGQQLSLMDDEERIRINSFDWISEFKEIMEVGGFDAVIGNPPYIGFHGFKSEKNYLRKKYQSAEGKFDIYLPFIEKGVFLLRESGLLSFICPTNFMKREHGKKLREIISTNVRIVEICDFEDVQIFKGVLNYTGVFVFRKETPTTLSSFSYRRRSLDDQSVQIQQNHLGAHSWVFRDQEALPLIRRMEIDVPSKLGLITDSILEGIVTGKNDVFIIDRSWAEKSGFEKQLLRPCLRGSEVRRYFLEDYQEYVIYPYKLSESKTVPLAESELRKFPLIYGYLIDNRRKLLGRGYFERSSKEWFELWNQRDIAKFSRIKIVVPELARSNRFALADGDLYYGDTVCGITLKTNLPEDINYVLGLLNSHLLEFYFMRTSVPKANGFFIYKTMFLKSLPIRRINFSDSFDRLRHDRVVSLVKETLELHKKLSGARTEQDRTPIQRQIAATDKQIDDLVYELYGLTEEERKIVEGS